VPSLIDNESEKREKEREGVGERVCKFRKTNTGMNLAVMKRGLIKPRLDRASYKIMIEPIKLLAKFSLATSSPAAKTIEFRENRAAGLSR